MMSRLIGEILKEKFVVVFFEFSPFADLYCYHDISKSITARSFKPGQLIEDDE